MSAAATFVCPVCHHAWQGTERPVAHGIIGQPRCEGTPIRAGGEGWEALERAITGPGCADRY